MKKWISILAVGIMMVSLATGADAARRFGGGLSFGRPAPTQMAPANRGFNAPGQQTRPQAAPQQQKAAPTAGAATQATRPASPLRGILMGAATALGLAWLANYLGISSELMTILMFALVAFAGFSLLRMLFSRQPRTAEPRPTVRTGGADEPRAARPQTASFQAASGSVMDEFQGTPSRTDSSVSLPVGFDQYAFLEECKKNFSKLQAAWSTGNVLQLSDFCTDEVFTVLTHQLRDRKGEALSIKVLSLSAQLGGFAEEASEYVAAVHFTGRLDVSGEIEEVNEVWSLVKPVKEDGRGWLLAGIQQVEP